MRRARRPFFWWEVTDMAFGPIQAGRLRIERPLALAPMAGVTSWPFRLLCKEQGCGLVVTEFVNDMSILHGNQRTREMMELRPSERPAGVQIFGAHPDTMARAAARAAEAVQPDLLDINMGCPAPKITRGRGGSSLLCEPDNAQSIVAAVVRAVAPLPVTVKMRIGWDAGSVNAVDMARRVEDAGAIMLTVHGRTREQHYGGEADWAVIAAVAAAVRIPVLGNGDISTPEQARHRLEMAGVRGIAIGRGALGNPWLFHRTARFLETGELLPEPGAAERVATGLRHLDLMVQYRGEYLAVREMRKHLAWYLKGLYGSAETRNRINAAESVGELQEILGTFLDQYPTATSAETCAVA